MPFFLFSSPSSLPRLSLSSFAPTFSLCLTTYWKYQYQIAVPRCGCSFAERLRLLSELMSHMCGGSGPHQSWRRLRGHSLLGLEGAQREPVIRAPAESTGLTNTLIHCKTKSGYCATLTHTGTHTYSIAADARRYQCKSLFPILKESQRDCLSVCGVNWHSESLVNIVSPVHKNLAWGCRMNEPFHYWDVNIVCMHDITRTGKNYCLFTAYFFDCSICHWRNHSLTQA